MQESCQVLEAYSDKKIQFLSSESPCAACCIGCTTEGLHGLATLQPACPSPMLASSSQDMAASCRHAIDVIHDSQCSLQKWDDNELGMMEAVVTKMSRIIAHMGIGEKGKHVVQQLQVGTLASLASCTLG